MLIFLPLRKVAATLHEILWHLPTSDDCIDALQLMKFLDARPSHMKSTWPITITYPKPTQYLHRM
jgi:hypothetical protein